MTTLLKPVLFIVFVVAQLGVLGLMIFDRHQLVTHGTVIRLQSEPIDPRSLLSGDYVILRYAITRFDESELDRLIRGKHALTRAKPVWVALKRNDTTGFYEASAIAANREDLLGEEIVLRGYAGRTWGGLEVRYGLESYFVPQGEGKKIERQLADVSVDVAVNDRGDSALVRLFINGEEVNFH